MWWDVLAELPEMLLEDVARARADLTEDGAQVLTETPLCEQFIFGA